MKKPYVMYILDDSEIVPENDHEIKEQAKEIVRGGLQELIDQTTKEDFFFIYDGDGVFWGVL